ncbi:HD-GYP domain-containing protein [Paenibacillus sp. GP183]|uniref:HD-GYP domain-containing protein n=1 Tax=Paenibacillus sp. GP183 TaxID=1882751 RepID=UPI0008942890|nr:HD-GYP domain-containing protein [Paenibacillus sp. GP183]SEB90446.1 HDIG domain-containing protein [Paenibacillus sp. GP183]
MRIHVEKLAVGDILISDTFNVLGLNVISKGTLLNVEDIQKLNNHNIEYVEISPRYIEQTQQTESIATTFHEEQALAFTNAIEGIKSLFDIAALEGLIQDEEVQAAFNPLINSFQHENDVVSLLLSLNSKDDYTYQHSVQVGMLSYYIAKWLGKSDQESLKIGKAGYLHDIGKCKIDSVILKKPGRLDDAEFAEIKRHTIYGYEIIDQSFHDHALSMATLQHHERLDGRGYPMGKKNEDIHAYAKIVAVADVYSAMICRRVYQEKRDMLIVLKELYRMSFGELDPEAAHVFIKHMIPNFIGKQVILSDGRSGTIIMTNPNDFFKPLVQIDNQFFDLSYRSGVEIISVDMQAFIK